MELTHSLRFFTSYLRNPATVGAVAPSSRALAAALCEPLRHGRRPAKVLEVGAGTGAVTRRIGRLLGKEDCLDVCEIEPRFADLLARNVLTLPDFAPGVAQGRVRLIRGAVQDVIGENEYDYVISGLPFTAFQLADVETILATIRRCLKPGGVFSYFEYIGLRRISRTFTLGKGRDRIRSVSARLSDQIRAHQFARRTVLTNLPPARARHLRFGGLSTAGPSRVGAPIPQ